MRSSRARESLTARGQAFVEFALVFPVFVLVLGAVIQFGLTFWRQSTLNQVVRDAGRYAATVASCTSGTADILARTRDIQAQAGLRRDVTGRSR